MKKQQHTPLLSPKEIEGILSSGILYDWNSIFVIDNETRHFRYDKVEEDYLSKSNRLREAYLKGATIIVQKLENYSLKLREYSLHFSPAATIHMYLTPPGGAPSFDFHCDDTDVCVHMVIGEKTFEILDKNGKITKHHLQAGQELFLPKGTMHRAISKDSSCLLSFGFEPLADFPVLPAVTAEDFL